ncbi:MAG: hypothetical protein Q4C61_10960 [Lachnospiraceae bacterium]|nr:hypothetical protein [Lachnospiraceae bacterium]
MTDEQRKKIENRILFLSIGILVLLIAALVLIGVKGVADTLLFPTVIAVFLAIYWVISDVLSVVWLHSFEGKTDDQKRSYYLYAGLDLIGLGGLVYFMVDMKSTTGAIIYVCCLFLKRRFKDEFNGVQKDEDEEEAEAEESSAEVKTIEEADAEAEESSAEVKTIETAEESSAEVKTVEAAEAETEEEAEEKAEVSEALKDRDAETTAAKEP